MDNSKEVVEASKGDYCYGCDCYECKNKCCTCIYCNRGENPIWNCDRKKE